MTGRSIEYVFPPRPETARDRGEPVLEVRDLSLAGVFTGVDLTVHAGEIVGLAGLVGAGRSEIIETVYGARRATTGTVTVDGKRLRRGSVTSAVRAGVGLAPEERKSQGLLLDEAVYRNITMSSMTRFSRFGFLDRGEERRRAAELTASLDVRPDGVDPRGPHPVGRQPAEGRARPLAAARLPGAAARRAHPRRRRRRPLRDLPAHPVARRPRRRRRGRVQRDRGGARSRRPGPRRPRGRGRPRVRRHRRSTRPRSSTSSWKERFRHEPGQRAGRAGRTRDRPRAQPGPRPAAHERRPQRRPRRRAAADLHRRRDHGGRPVRLHRQRPDDPAAGRGRSASSASA